MPFDALGLSNDAVTCRSRGCDRLHLTLHPLHLTELRWPTVALVDSQWPPQLWDLDGPDDGGDIAAEAGALALASTGELGLADRWRGWRGSEVRVHLSGNVRHGRVERIYRDAVVISDGDREVLIPLSAVAMADGPAPGPAVAPFGRERGSGLGAAREWVGDVIRLGLATGAEYQGLLVTVGADHLELSSRGASVLVGWDSIAWVQRQP